ncbi:MAG: hypothetical protein QF554_03130 [Dehalococcoidia bacterium]|jgi:hypothetical protein|nr:hypothetical protein [Dehalococcoidia bacterium]
MSDRNVSPARALPEERVVNAEPSPAEILDLVRQIESSVVAGRSIAAAVTEIGITGETYDLWRDACGELDREVAGELTRLEQERARIKRVADFLTRAEATLDKRISERAGG